MDYGEFDPLDPDTDPVLLYSVGEPRIIDTIFNVSSLTSGIFNNSLLQYAGVVIVGIILFGKQLISERLNCEFCYETLCCEGGLAMLALKTFRPVVHVVRDHMTF